MKEWINEWQLNDNIQLVSTENIIWVKASEIISHPNDPIKGIASWIQYDLKCDLSVGME